MKALFWLLALFAMAVGIALLAHVNDGYLLLVFPPYRAEVSLNLAILALLFCFAALHGLLRSVTAAVSLPARVRAFRERRRTAQAEADFQDALLLLFEGRFSQSVKKADAAHDAGYAPGLSALLAANAVQRLREPLKQAAWLDLAGIGGDRMQAARLMLEAQMHLDTGDFEAAVFALQRLQQVAGRHIAALRLELRAQQGCGNWGEVLRIARLLEKRDRLQPELAREIKLKAHREQIRLYRSDAGQLLAYLREVPHAEHESRLVRAAAEALIELGADTDAQALIEKQLDAEWDSSLAQLYGKLKGGDPTSRIARADKWLQQHNDDAQLLLALGRQCIALRLWGKAQSYLEASLSLEDRRETRLELARLLENTERADEAMRHYRAAAENSL